MTTAVWVAVDTPDPARARAIAEAVREHVGGLKLGLEFFAANGPDGVRKLARLGLPLFLDLKLHDIPNTVGQAVAALAPLAPAILTVHAGGGRAMLAAAKAAAPAGTRVVAVTVLTSLGPADLMEIGWREDPSGEVERLATLARAAGVDGLVCSGGEVAAARKAWPDALLVVPGVRPAGGVAGDQKRVVTPPAAMAAGASLLVVGRPITAATDMREAARAIALEL